MPTKKNEVKLELLIGRKVVDANGKPAGRIEEIIAERDGDELVVTEYHLSAYGFLERLGIRTLLRLAVPKPERVPWERMDLSDPEKPRLV
jgi:sporulation protein YlmC with PRC-barrel domain